jgi:hypothetical protein
VRLEFLLREPCFEPRLGSYLKTVEKDERKKMKIRKGKRED